jgi:type IV fimbrial biogenesis protein FimT
LTRFARREVIGHIHRSRTCENRLRPFVGARSRGANRVTRRRVAGWTVVEMAIAVVLTGLLLALGVPSYRAWIADYELRSAAETLVSAMAAARSEAVKRGDRVNLCKSPDRRQCAADGGWEGGWLLYVDANRDGRVDDDEPLLRVEGPAPPGIRIEANRPLDDYVSFTSLGHARLLSGALQMGSFRVCRGTAMAWKVVLANSGRARLERTAEPCT